MNKLLHIIAAPRGADSRTLKVSHAFLDSFIKKYPSCHIEGLELFKETLPPLTLEVISGKYVLLGGRSLDEKLQNAWKDVERYINQFLSADLILISTPMWNFSIPYFLKQYIDIIVQPKYLFRYTDKGTVGLAADKKMVVVTSRGGDYTPGSPSAAYDYQEPYLRAIFGLCGIKGIIFVNAQPVDMGNALQ